YLPSPPFDTLFGTEKRSINPISVMDEGGRRWTEDEIRIEMNAYDGSIAYLDQHIGSLIDELSRRGIMDNTLLVVAADHGEEFAEHGLMGHSWSLYFPVIHVPLLLRFPSRIPTDLVVDDAVTLRDIAATILDLAGVEGDG